MRHRHDYIFIGHVWHSERSCMQGHFVSSLGGWAWHWHPHPHHIGILGVLGAFIFFFCTMHTCVDI